MTPEERIDGMLREVERGWWAEQERLRSEAPPVRDGWFTRADIYRWAAGRTQVDQLSPRPRTQWDILKWPLLWVTAGAFWVILFGYLLGWI